MLLRCSSRQSDLAKIQAWTVGTLIKEKLNSEVEFHFRESLGDKNLTDPLWKMPEKGVFTEDFLNDLIENRTDLVVHSWKDLPTQGNPQTEIIATLPREDQRDLLLIKKTSIDQKKPNLLIFSSSPRREFNLISTLPELLPWTIESIQFRSVRGNVPTRIRKLLEDDLIDGLVLAKAGFDRLLSHEHSSLSEMQKQLREALDLTQWIVLPLELNPNAAAQGALAIEIKKSNSPVRHLLQKINCPKSFLAAEREREILRKFGGGCHLKIGISVLERAYGRIEILRGVTPEGKNLNTRILIPRKARPEGLTKIPSSEIAITDRKEMNVPDLSSYDAILVSRNESLTSSPSAHQIVWTSGLSTWKKLAQRGIWVNGSAESLGEQEDPNIERLTLKHLKWVRLTHSQSPQDRPKTREIDHIATYEATYQFKNLPDHSNAFFYWKSGALFRAALQKFSFLKNAHHACGPGRTFDQITALIKNDERVHIYLSEGDWLNEK